MITTILVNCRQINSYIIGGKKSRELSNSIKFPHFFVASPNTSRRFTSMTTQIELKDHYTTIYGFHVRSNRKNKAATSFKTLPPVIIEYSRSSISKYEFIAALSSAYNELCGCFVRFVSISTSKGVIHHLARLIACYLASLLSF